MDGSQDDAAAPAGPLAGVRVLDLSRILAGPTCTQLMGDLGADVIKVEKPGAGDDTRKWGPPYLQDADGNDTAESAYYLSSNRNKRSIAVDLAAPAGQALVRRLAERADVLIENFKVGALAAYGLSYADLRDAFPRLVYCSITGFGQYGPYAGRPGYDLLAQAMGGIMSVTGQPDGPPTKVGVGIADVMTGMYATIAILAALRHRDRTGQGQHIDVALLDCQIAWLINEGTNYLVSGINPQRRGNEHPNIVPYSVFEAADGHVILAVGNDAQFQRWCGFAGAADLAADPRFATNADRVRNRTALYAAMPAYMAAKTRDQWIDGLAAAGVPCSPVNTIADVFADPNTAARGMRIAMPHPQAGGDGTAPLIGNPLKLSATPVAYRRPPPTLGQHSDEVLGDWLDADADAIDRLRRDGALG
ncbi:MAG: CaiB/BaiF CoA-transferase family protein [Alphaproteobacteria bacterium]